MEMKTFKVTYKNGNILIRRAYSMTIEDGKVYECEKALTGDQGVPAVYSAENIEKLEELTGRPFTIIRKMSGLTQDGFAKRYGIPKRSIENWEAASDTAYREPPEYLLRLLERVVKEDYKLG